MARFVFPHPFTLLVAGILLAAALTWIVPAGQFERRTVEIDGAKREVVVAGTYHTVAAKPVGAFAAIIAIPKGIIEAADIVVFVFLAGGAFTVVDDTGALRHAVSGLARAMGTARWLVIPVVSLLFALGGILENLQEEIIALVPVILLLCRRCGYDALTACAISIGAAAVGSSFSPINPFQSVIAQKISEVVPFSASGYRVAFLLPALAIWIGGTMLYARRNPAESDDAEVLQATTPATATLPFVRLVIVLALVLAAFAFFIYGVLVLHWGFEELSAVFFAMGILAGLAGGLGANGTARSYVVGFQSMAFAALLIGFARGIRHVMEDGQIIDTVVLGLFNPIAHLPRALAVAGMVIVQTLIHVPVPSVSGQAVLTLPILNPLSDLLAIPRQVVVLAYQYGAGLCELLTPTNGALLAILGAAGVPFGKWLRFCLPLYALLLALGIVAAVLGLMIGLK